MLPDPATGDPFGVTYMEPPPYSLFPFSISSILLYPPQEKHMYVFLMRKLEEEDRIKSLEQSFFIPSILLHDIT